MLRPAQVVAAFDAVAALAADDAAGGEWAECQQLEYRENRSIKDRVDRKAGPDWAEGDCIQSVDWDECGFAIQPPSLLTRPDHVPHFT